MGTSSKDPSGPRFVRFFGPVVAALNQLGGSARPSEVRDKVAEDLQVSAEVQSETLSSGAARFDNQIAWARFYLVRAGIIDSSRRGVWALTEKGRAITTMTDAEALTVFKSVQAGFSSAPEAATEAAPTSTEETPPPQGASGPDHRVQVLETLHALPPAGFERFCQRLLRESGFEEVTVTGRSGDGGIDGIGILKANVLVSFKVVFQCKRYRNSGAVNAGQVRDFRGAMMGRADKGIILTTGFFTSDARRESTRDGVPPIELVDGEKLVDMLEDLELGLVSVKGYRLNEAFFAEFGAGGGDMSVEAGAARPRRSAPLRNPKSAS